MSEQSNERDGAKQSALTVFKLRQFFISQLNRIYCAKAHLAERLPEMAEQSHFIDLRYALVECCEDIEKQLIRMEEIYVLLEEQPTIEKCDGLVSLIEEAFDTVYDQGDQELRDLSIIYYLQNIESQEVSSFKLLIAVANRLGNEKIPQLLIENMQEAKEDRLLLRMICDKYFVD